jgi:hypothetical protein
VANTFDHQTFVILGKTFGRERTIWKENANNGGPEACKETEHQKQKLPIFDWAVREMGDAKAQKASDLKELARS